MRAAVCDRYGPPDVVEVRDVDDPVVGDGDVLIEAVAGTVDVADARIRALRVPRGLSVPVRLQMGLTRPKHPILGLVVAGQVAAVGSAVTRFRVGDRVVASRGFRYGCHAERVVVAEDGAIAALPDSVSPEDAVAVVFGGTTALYFLGRAGLGRGDSVLVNGASGAVGTMAVQIARHLGAKVTGVCSAANAQLVGDIGADRVIDYATEDFTRDGHRYDVIMDCHGNAPYPRAKGSLAPGGRFVMIIAGLPQMIAATWQKPVIGPSDGGKALSAAHLEMLVALLDAQELTPVVDMTVPLDRIVEAHRRVDSGHKVGSIVLTF
jgi:NADPH:quinone reductase-like Zn-dependent oxidoreductase